MSEALALLGILVGNILTSGVADLATVVYLSTGIALLHWLFARRLLHSTDSTPWIWEFFFYATFGVIVTSSVALGGVLLVFSLLIVPAAIGMLYSTRFLPQLLIAWAAGAAASLLGLIASYSLDLPTGATMVCSLGISLGIAGLMAPFLRDRAPRMSHRFITALRSCLAAVLCVSGAWLMAAPKADQPLLDLAEALWPGLRTLYMDDDNARIFAEAQADAARFRREAQRLDKIEARRRWDGSPLDDDQLRANSSFQRVYGEMSRGEAFVMREVRGRERERSRWLLGASMLGAGLVLVPGLGGRFRLLLGPAMSGV